MEKKNTNKKNVKDVKETKKEIKEEEVKKTKKETPKKEIKKEEVKETKIKDKVNVEKKEKIAKDKIFKGILVVLVVAVVLGLAAWSSDSYGKNTEPFEFTYIDVDKYLEYLNDSEARIIYVARPNCSYCQMESPIIKRLASKYDLTLNYLDTTNFLEYDENGEVLRDSEGNPIYTETGKKFMASAEVYNNGWGTPNTIIVKDGKIVDGIYQYVEESELKTLFKNNGFI